MQIKRILELCHQAQFNRTILLCHGWEWIVLLTLASWLSNWNPWIFGVLIGIGQHMILDSYYNSSNLLSYSLIWRWKNNFHFDTVFAELKYIKYKYQNHSSDDSQI